MDSLTLAFALAGVDAIKLGRGRSTDLLLVSLSTTDAVGHTFGPDSRELHDQVLRVDRYLAWFLGRLFDRYGRQNILVVLTADHGVTPFTAYARGHGHPDARAVTLDTLVSAANAELDRAFGTGTPRTWLLFDTGILFLRDNGRLSAVGANVDSIGRALAARVRRVTGVARADAPADLARADTADDAVARRWRHQLPADAGALLAVTLQPFSVWMPDSIAEHGQPSELDSHVPLILWGRGVKPGRFARRANTVDIAPTLARLLGISPLSLLDGRVLSEALAQGPAAVAVVPVHAQHLHRSRIGEGEAFQNFDSGCFAGAVGTEEAEAFPGLDGQIEPRHGDDVAEALDQPRAMNRRHVRRRAWVLRPTGVCRPPSPV